MDEDGVQAMRHRAYRQGKEGIKGATAVEFALVLPVFALLLFGIIDFGRYFFVQHTLQFATREGTRLALTGRTLGDDDNREASILRTIREKAAVAVDPGDVDIRIFEITSTYGDPEGWDTIDPTLPGAAGEEGRYMRVRTRYTYTFFTPFIGDLFTDGVKTIVAEATYHNESLF